MSDEKWVRHLFHWKAFLESRLLSVDDDGEREKINRQLLSIERVRYSAVLNPRLLIEFISPESGLCTYQEKELDFKLCLNESQKKAVFSVINGESLLSLIQGPPGTGKTQVISEICLQILNE